jgi:hypothetical protein
MCRSMEPWCPITNAEHGYLSACLWHNLLMIRMLQGAMPSLCPADEQVVEVRLDSYPPESGRPPHPLGPIPAASVLQAPQPLLLVRCRDERLFVYRLQHTVPSTALRAQRGKEAANGHSPRLSLIRQPFDWLRCGSKQLVLAAGAS